MRFASEVVVDPTHGTMTVDGELFPWRVGSELSASLEQDGIVMLNLSIPVDGVVYFKEGV